MKSTRSLNLALVVALAFTLAVAFPGFSSAAFTASSNNTAQVRAAVDWTPPKVTMVAPAAVVRETVKLAATASDAETGIAQVTIEGQPANGVWSTACTTTSAPFTCDLNTKTVADGQYSLRAVALDRAGYQTTSTVVSTRVDNTAPTVTMLDPGTNLNGVRTFGANAADAGSGVAKVDVQYAASGTSTYADLCSASTAPWSCAFDTASLPNGSYSFRAIATDRAGNTLTSTPVTNRVVDNNAALFLDVQAQNGGSTPGLIEVGDSITYTFNRQVNLNSIVPNWNGSARTVSVDLSRDDILEVTGVNLGRVDLIQNYIGGFGATFRATMTASTESGPGGALRTTVKVRFDEATAGGSSGPKVVDVASHMVWTPSGAVTDLLGRSSATTRVTESGPLDREF